MINYESSWLVENGPKCRLFCSKGFLGARSSRDQIGIISAACQNILARHYSFCLISPEQTTRRLKKTPTPLHAATWASHLVCRQNVIPTVFPRVFLNPSGAKTYLGNGKKDIGNNRPNQTELNAPEPSNRFPKKCSVSHNMTGNEHVG